MRNSCVAGATDPHWRARIIETYRDMLEPGLVIYVRDGCNRIVAEMMAMLELERAHDPESRWRLDTIKEKFGELRVVGVPRSAAAARLIVLAASESSLHTCDTCGEAGSMREDGCPLRVRCDNHLSETWLDGFRE